MKLTGQIFRYILVGIISNIALFLLYLTLTYFGLEHKLSMSLLYITGVTQTFAINKIWTFENSVAIKPALNRYAVAYGIGYMVNLSALLLFVDYLLFPHQIVQGIMIIVLASFLFILQKFWVFRPQAPFAANRTSKN